MHAHVTCVILRASSLLLGTASLRTNEFVAVDELARHGNCASAAHAHVNVGGGSAREGREFPYRSETKDRQVISFRKPD